MAKFNFTFALECTATVEAENRSAAAEIVFAATRRGATADLWRPFDQNAAERGEPAKGVQDVQIRRIGSIS